jgi:CheY-like chemotaxis protein
MKNQGDTPSKLREWLIDDTGSEEEAEHLLPVAQRLWFLGIPKIDPAKRAEVIRLMLRERPTRQTRQKQQRIIVCIDNNTAEKDLIEVTLGAKGFKVLGASNGSEGLKMISERDPDLVLVDVMLPGMDGWDVYQYMKADDWMRTIPVIVMTDKEPYRTDHVLEYRLIRPHDYITRPFSPGDLIERVSKVLGYPEG